jgi:glycosyltransferase involved in cell wall biosynthesis
MRVLFYTPSFTERRAGVEMRYCLLANELIARGASVRFLTARDRRNPRPKFPLHESAQVHFAKVETESVQPLLDEFRPEIVITVNGRKTSHLLAQLAVLRPHVIVTEQLNPRDMSRIMGSEHERLENLRRADRIHVLLPSYRQTLPSELQARCIVIPNQCSVPADGADSLGRRLAEGHRKRIVYVARLDRRQKRQQILVEAFARLRGRFPDWELWLWGDRHDWRTLAYFHGLIRLRHVSSRTFMPGSTDSVVQEYLRSQLLVFPSAFEGFPQALLQGMACGLACVGFAGCEGVNELIVDEVTGLLAPGTDDPDALALKMASLMSDDDLRERYGLAGREMAKQYTFAKFMAGWLELVDGVYRDRQSGIRPAATPTTGVGPRM